MDGSGFAVVREEKSRGFLFFFLAGLVIGASAQALIYVLLLDYTVGIWLPAGQGPAKAASDSVKVVLFHRSNLVPPEEQSSYERRVAQWISALSGNNVTF